MMPEELSSTSSMPFATRISTIFCTTGTVVEVAGTRVDVGETFVAATVDDAVGIIVGGSVRVGVTDGILVAVTDIIVLVAVIAGVLVAVAAVTVFVGVTPTPCFQTLT
jgi:hypothetical protein